MKFIQIKLIVSLFLFLVACSSTPVTSFYQLRSIQGDLFDSTQAKNKTILVSKIKFPEYLDHPQIVSRKK